VLVLRYVIHKMRVLCDNGLDVNECVDESICDQQCHNSPGSYECSCHTGYTLNTTDRRTCSGETLLMRWCGNNVDLPVSRDPAVNGRRQSFHLFNTCCYYINTNMNASYRKLITRSWVQSRSA